MREVYYISVFLIFVLISCNNEKLFREVITKDDVVISWYFYSYISDTSPDFIEITKDDSSTLIYKGISVIRDIEVNNDTILISHLKFQENSYIKKRTKPIYGYTIVYKEVSSHEIYKKWLENQEK